MTTEVRGSKAIWTKSRLAEMSPAYFGLVMSTGIVSIAADLLGYRTIAFALFYLNIAQYAVLAVLYLLKAGRYPRRFFGQLVSHAKGPAYFTVVAGTGILSSQFFWRSRAIPGSAPFSGQLRSCSGYS